MRRSAGPASLVVSACEPPPNRPLSRAQRREIAAHWEVESEKDLLAAITDSVLYELMLEPVIDNPVLMRFYRAAIERFKDRVSPQRVRDMVDLVVVVVLRDRARTKKAPKRSR